MKKVVSILCGLLSCLLLFPCASAAETLVPVTYGGTSFFINGTQVVLQDQDGTQYQPIICCDSIYIPAIIAGEWMGKFFQASDFTGDIFFETDRSPVICHLSEQRQLSDDEVAKLLEFKHNSSYVTITNSDMYIEQEKVELRRIDGQQLPLLKSNNIYYIPIRTVAEKLNMNIVCSSSGNHYSVFLWSSLSPEEYDAIDGYISGISLLCNDLDSCLSQFWIVNGSDNIDQAIAFAEQIVNFPAPVTKFSQENFQQISTKSQLLLTYLSDYQTQLSLDSQQKWIQEHFFDVHRSMAGIWGPLYSMKNAFRFAKTAP